MGHHCRIFGRLRPNEQFSGPGHRIHVCKRCKAMPKGERQVIENMNDIFRFMRQSQVAQVKPYATRNRKCDPRNARSRNSSTCP
jgi:hypothetical protein